MQTIMGYLGKKFKFSYYEEEDLFQEAFVIAVTALPQWDQVRPIGGFLYVKIYTQLCNLKRKKYERRTLPCESCPIAAWVNKKCTAYSDQMDCSLYYRWHQRNCAKKSLASPNGYSEFSPKVPRKPDTMPQTKEEIEDEYKKVLEAMPSHIRVKYFTGKDLNEDELDEIRENLYI